MIEFEKYIEHYKNVDQSDWVNVEFELDDDTKKILDDACEKYQVDSNIIISAILQELIEKEKKMKLQIEVDHELSDKITLTNLKDSYDSVCSDIYRLSDKEEKLLKHQKADLRAAIKAERFLRKTINYFSLEEDKIQKYNEDDMINFKE